MKTPRQLEQETIWQRHLDSWRESGQTQADYCGLNGLSTASFSKWKKKLHPKLEGRALRKKPKSRYSKHSKLSDSQYEALIDVFFTTQSLKEVNNKTGISTKSISKTFEELQTATIDGALQYPHLFFGAGTLLLLCPPPDCYKRMLQYKTDFPNKKYQYRAESTREGRLRNNIEFIFRLLISYTGYEWSLAETFVFREWGLGLFYRNSYVLEQNIDPEKWSQELYHQLASDINLIRALQANMDHWTIELKQVSPISNEQWDRVFKQRTVRSYNNKWADQMAHDLKWTLRHKIIGGTDKQRNTYWDEFAPDVKEVRVTKSNFA